MTEHLTEEQRKLVEDNHDLIYEYANENNISIDEYYDVLAIALCDAAIDIYKEKSNYRSFKDLAYDYMWICMTDANYYDMKWEDSVKFIDEAIDYSDYDISELAIDKMSAEKFLNSLSKNEKYIVECLAYGMNSYQISGTMDCTYQSINECINRLKKKAVKYLYY